MFSTRLPNFIAVFSVTLFSFGGLPVLADDYSDGIISYSNGNYGAAKASFIAATQRNPKQWQAQYQLANTCLHLSDLPGAKAAYQACLLQKPSPDIQQHCTRALAYLSNTKLPTPNSITVQHRNWTPPPMYHGSSLISANTPAVAPSESTSIQKADTGTASVKEEPSDFRTQAINARKQRILAESRQEADKIRAEGRQRVQEGHASANQWWISHDGQLSVGMSHSEESEIMREHEKRASAALEEGKKRAALVTTP